jgi:hypothetical protein
MLHHMINILTELGKRLSLLDNGNANDVRAARSIAADMLTFDNLAAWLDRYPTLPVTKARNILIIMAGNIPFVGLHDLVCVLASGHRAMVKPSSKDMHIMSWVVSQLLDIAPGLPVSMVENLSCLPDAVIAMGSNDTVRALREQYAGIPMLLRGHRSSLAVLDGSETKAELTALADDILSYSGLGCRNVSLVFVPTGFDFTELKHALAQCGSSHDVKHYNNYRQVRALLKMTAIPYIDCRSCLLIEKQDFPADISVINYAYYNERAEAEKWIAQHDAEIQCIACGSIVGIEDHPRYVALGMTQRPGLGDYPDGCDTMQFLLTL